MITTLRRKIKNFMKEVGLSKIIYFTLNINSRNLKFHIFSNSYEFFLKLIFNCNSMI